MVINDFSKILNWHQIITLPLSFASAIYLKITIFSNFSIGIKIHNKKRDFFNFQLTIISICYAKKNVLNQNKIHKYFILFFKIELQFLKFANITYKLKYPTSFRFHVNIMELKTRNYMDGNVHLLPIVNSSMFQNFSTGIKS